MVDKIYSTKDKLSKWTSNIKLSKALAYVKSHAYSFTTAVPDNIHCAVIKMLESESKQRYGTLESEVSVPNQISLSVIKKSQKKGS